MFRRSFLAACAALVAGWWPWRNAKASPPLGRREGPSYPIWHFGELLRPGDVLRGIIVDLPDPDYGGIRVEIYLGPDGIYRTAHDPRWIITEGATPSEFRDNLNAAIRRYKLKRGI